MSALNFNSFSIPNFFPILFLKFIFKGMENTKKIPFNEVKKHLEFLFKFLVSLELSKNLESWDNYYEEIKKELIEECKQFYFKFPLIKENIIKNLEINCINIIKSYIDGRIEVIIF